jgi:hypothetical protein
MHTAIATISALLLSTAVGNCWNWEYEFYKNKYEHTYKYTRPVEGTARDNINQFYEMQKSDQPFTTASGPEAGHFAWVRVRSAPFTAGVFAEIFHDRSASDTFREKIKTLTPHNVSGYRALVREYTRCLVESEDRVGVYETLPDGYSVVVVIDGQHPGCWGTIDNTYLTRPW